MLQKPDLSKMILKASPLSTRIWMNRIGRRIAYAMLVILMLAIVWQVLGPLQGRPSAGNPKGPHWRDP